VKFRDDPVLKYKGFRSWPPLWVDIDTNAWKTISGEVGVLTEVRLRDSNPCRLFLTIRHDGISYLGVLFFDNEPACLPVYNFLKTHIGRTIEEIGGMELT